LQVLQAIRDVAIIILAVETIVIGALVGILVWQVWNLVGLARKHFERLSESATDILGSVKETAQTTAETAKTAQSTAKYVSDRTAQPVIELYSAVAGASRFARAMFGPRPSSRDDGGER